MVLVPLGQFLLTYNRSFGLVYHCTANTIRRTNANLMLTQRLGRLANIKSILARRLVFAGIHMHVHILVVLDIYDRMQQGSATPPRQSGRAKPNSSNCLLYK